MVFKLYTSNCIETLSTLFCNAIKQKVRWNQVSIIAVQNKGLEKWLAKQAATQNKIFANYEFTHPDSFIGRIHHIAKNYTNSYFSAENMKWKMYTYLCDEAFVSAFPAVSKYYEGDDIKRIQLAGKIADLFDKYQIYRPHIIEAWNMNTALDDADGEHFAKEEAWQRWLWQRLKSESNGRQDNFQGKQNLLKKMDSSEFQEAVKASFPHIHLFGIAVFSNYHWEIYQKLSSIIDISIYTTSPSCTADWHFDSVSTEANELLGSCKEINANLRRLLPTDGEHSFAPPQGDSLLATIQRDIYYNHNEGIKNYVCATDDSSLRMVSSYTPAREVEALYNYLLNAFENNPDLKGSEVSVQLTDVDLYAPLIKAVFDNAPKKIPYIISDQDFSMGDSLIKAVDIFFNLPHANFKAENVLQLFDYKAIRQRFDVQDVELIRQLIADANIRYGIEGNKDDDTYLFSWKHGLSKLVLGYAIKGGASYSIDDEDYYPTDSIEGTEALNIFKIKAFAETLFQLYAHSKSMKTIVEWKDYLLNEVFDALFSVGDSYNDELDYIYKKLENLGTMTIEVNEKISFQVFREGLVDLLRTDAKHSTYTSGLVTFSAILPVGSIPYKHIAILGLNAGEFPRQQKQLGFDLMAIHPMPNDRNTKDNDKYLFLEALLSARDALYLSYIGSSIKDNSELPPSLLVEELEDYIVTGTGDKDWVTEQLKYKHPLHASSKLYFENKKFFTYFGETEEEQLPDLEENTEKEEAVINFDEINLNDLVSFYKDPFKWYYNKVLRIYYTDDAILLPDEEPFELDNLQKWSLKNELVALDADRESSYLKRRKNDGDIPLANMAEAELNIEKAAIEQVRQIYLEQVDGELKSEPISLKLGDSVLRGTIEKISDKGQVHYNVSGGSSQAKYLLDIYIKHLAYKACHDHAQSLFISSTYNFTLEDNFIEVEEAVQTLSQLVEVYKLGHTQIIPFTPKAGLLLMNAMFHIPKTVSRELAINRAIKEMVERYPSDYIAKEFSLGYFDLLLSGDDLNTDDLLDVEDKQDSLFHLSDILFRKLSTLLSTF